MERLEKRKVAEYIENPYNLNSYKTIPIKMSATTTTFSYSATGYYFVNHLPNASFENGFWGNKVGDCNNYDNNPVISMDLDTQDKTDGNQSLELDATRHNSCTATQIPIAAGSKLLFSFDYQSPNKASASYYIGFNDPTKTSISQILPVNNKTWNSFSTQITVPAGATKMALYIYARENNGKTKNIVRYDNFKLIQVPDLTSTSYLVSTPTTTPLVQPKSVAFDLINPTKKLVHITGATTPFFLAMSESYDSHWQLEMNDQSIKGFLNSWWPFAKPAKIPDEDHYQLDGFLNAWYVDVPTLCADSSACTKNPDGSYNIDMVIEFWPQRWFYLGLIISGTTLLGCLGYLGYTGVRALRRRKK